MNKVRLDIAESSVILHVNVCKRLLVIVWFTGFTR